MKVFFVDNYLFGTHSDKFDAIMNEEIMKEFGIELVDKLKKADILIACRIDCEIIHCKKPVILCERYDSISIGTVPQYYTYKKIKAIFKDYLPRDINTVLDTTVKKRHHFKVLNDIYKVGMEDDCILPDIDEYLDKFKMVPWGISQYSHLSLNKHMKYCIDNLGKFSKTIDIFCVCHYHEEPLLSHRKHIKQIVKSMEGKYKVYCEDNVDKATFHEKLMSSRIVVAPWGIGKRVASDQKGILSDCVVVKPDTNNVLTFPDIYQDKYYVKCKEDLSDLVDVCEMVLKDYDTYLKRTIEAKKILNEVTQETYQRNFFKNVVDVYKSK